MKLYKAETNADLEFSFPDELQWEELDRQDARLPMGMSFVDLIIDREKDLLLVEIKDPSNSSTPDKERKKYLANKLSNNELIKQELTPKIRDSYTYIHLMERDIKPIIYIVLLGLDAFDDSVQKGILTNFKDRLLQNICNECEQPWKRDYVKDCVVLSVDGWNRTFKDWTIRRLSNALNP